MKAEHRKELQTNSLADFLGKTLQNVRGGGFSWVKIGLVLIVLVGIAAFFLIYRSRQRAEAEAWAKVQLNDYRTLYELTQNAKETRQGQIARFTLGYAFLWDGIRFLGASDVNAVREGVGVIAQSLRVFDELAKELADDNERLAEAKYHMAVGNEALASFHEQFLDEAKKAYEELTKGDLAGTAYGQLAKKRLDQFNNPAEHKAIVAFYKEFRERTQGPTAK